MDPYRLEFTDLTDKVKVQTNEFTALREDLKALQHKVSELEKCESEAKVIEERRVLEDEVLREFGEEENKIIVIGYEFDEGSSNLEEKLMKDILKDEAETMGRVKIVWKKGATDNKKVS